ncbi:MAG: universal stress protein [Acidimicrobiales bacterium]
MSGIGAIAVGYDGSEDSTAALCWAASLAAALDATLRVVHAVGLLEGAGLSPHVVAHRERALELATGAGLAAERVEWSAVDGDPCSALLRAADGPSPVGLLVVGSRGSGKHGGSLLGSTSLELAEHSSVPVTVVRPDAAVPERAPAT